MRIRTQLLLAAAGAAAVALTVLGSLWYVTHRNAVNLQSQSDGQDIARDVANLLTLTQEYTVYGGDRATQQWRARHAQLRQTVQQALARESTPHPALAEVDQRVADLLPLYDRLVETYRDDGSDLAQRRRELMVERLVSETQELVDARHRWATAVIEIQGRDQVIANTIMLAASAVLSVLIVGLAFLVFRRGLVPLARLQAATAAIQRGDLSVRCDAGTRDELGDTGRAVNAMAESLLAVNAALRESQERYELAVAGSDDGVFDWDYRSGRAFGSARAREILGLPAGPEMQSTAEWFAAVEAHLHPDDVARRRAAIEAHMAGRTPTYEGEFRVRNAEGIYRWVRIRGLCIRDAAGTPHRMAGSVSDVDAHKRAEESLRQSEERFALAVEASNEGILDWDLVNDRVFSSERAMRIVGIDSDVTVRTRAQWRDLVRIHPDDTQRVDDDFQGLLEGRSGLRDCEYRVLLPDGQYRWIHHRSICIRDAAGRPIRTAGSVSDIDAQKRAEQALRQSEARYQLAVDGANQGLWDWDLETNMQFVSPRAQELLGLAPGEPLRPRAEWLARVAFHPDDVAAVRAATSAHLRGHSPRHFEIEYRMRHQSGAWHWYRQRGIALRDERGHPYRMAGSMEDITAQKDAEYERLRLEKQLLQAKKLEAIGTLAGGIAHDFNNILAAILGNGEMAQTEAPEGTALRRHVDAVVTAGVRAKSLVERILAFSRSGIGDRTSVHVQSVVDEALHLVASSMPPHLRLERELAAGDACVLGDPTQIHQVVMNLCTNAVQAMKSTGTLGVVLDVAERNEGMTATNHLSSGRYIRLRVRDTGTGIAVDALERIFDPFFTTKDVGVGTGLGLSLVHRIVTDLGGGIDVESRVGEGTTFTVHLPWNTSLAAPVDAEEIVPNGTGETILLVDDEEVLVRLGEEMIARLGYEPVGFTSSVAALEALRAAPERFHAVLSDQAMPDMTGVELAREIRILRPDIPIVLMSGFVNAALLARAQGSGVTEVLAKPLVARDIARSLAGALCRADVSPGSALSDTGLA